MRDTHRRRSRLGSLRGARRGTQSPDPGSCPEPKAGTQPLSHPGVPARNNFRLKCFRISWPYKPATHHRLVRACSAGRSWAGCLEGSSPKSCLLQSRLPQRRFCDTAPLQAHPRASCNCGCELRALRAARPVVGVRRGKAVRSLALREHPPSGYVCSFSRLIGVGRKGTLSSCVK